MNIEKWRSRDSKQWQAYERKPIVIHRLHKELGVDISDLHFAVATNKCVMVDYAGESFFIRRIGDDWNPSLRKLAKLDSGLSFAGRSKLVRGG